MRLPLPAVPCVVSLFRYVFANFRILHCFSLRYGASNRRRLLDMAVFLTWSLSLAIRRIIMIIATIMMMMMMMIIIIITMQAGIKNILTLETS